MERLQRLLDDRKITVELDAAARTWLADKGYDPAYGARPLKRVIQKNLQDPLADLILSGDVGDGETVNAFVGLGQHTVEALVTRSSGESTASASIVIEDTTAPQIVVSLTDRRGRPIQNITRKWLNRVVVRYEATDDCDAAPEATATGGVPVESGDVISPKP